MKIEEDCFFDRMQKEVMLSPVDASIRQDGYERHSRGESIDDMTVKVCCCTLYKSNIACTSFQYQKLLMHMAATLPTSSFLEK